MFTSGISVLTGNLLKRLDMMDQCSLRVLPFHLYGSLLRGNSNSTLPFIDLLNLADKSNSTTSHHSCWEESRVNWPKVIGSFLPALGTVFFLLLLFNQVSSSDSTALWLGNGVRCGSVPLLNKASARGWVNFALLEREHLTFLIVVTGRALEAASCWDLVNKE